ncbi:hypothetical protein BMF94_0589 [Rhodotorula taiwanensis]|uniref:Proteophosphoglycan ppg4 n=1 Tax=Rhodotorula taiwanensis TaxID=741276 RepID=A0A2S5BHZ6_9BASI|nr:hypothetical protein BMF94_0589 [Rhodotorula taiwanensis]
MRHVTSSRIRAAFATIASAGWTISVRFLGRRSTLPTLLLLPAGVFFVLLAAVRSYAFLYTRRQRCCKSLSPASAPYGKLARIVKVRTSALLALAVICDTVVCGRLQLEYVVALRALLPPAILLAAPRVGYPAPAATTTAALSTLASSLVLSVAMPVTPLDPGTVAIGSIGVAAQALCWCELAATWAASTGSADAVILQSLSDLAPIGLLLSALLAFGNLILHLPAYRYFFAPRHLLPIICGSSLCGAATVALGLSLLVDAIREGDVDTTFSASSGGIYSSVLCVAVAINLPIDMAYGPRASLALGLAVTLGPLTSRRHRHVCEESLYFSESSPSTSSCSEDSYYSLPTSAKSTSANLSPFGAAALRQPVSPLSLSTSLSPSGTSERRPTRRITRSTILAAVPFGVMLLLSIPPLADLPSRPAKRPSRPAARSSAQRQYVDGARATVGRAPTLDIVFALYNETLTSFDKHVRHVKEQDALQGFRMRTTVYHKGSHLLHTPTVEQLLRLDGVDEVFTLPNLGREGGTYLHHILRMLEPSASPEGRVDQGSKPLPLADLTLFLQDHLDWSWVTDVRFDFVDARTGFLSLAPYVQSDCGFDLRTREDFPRVRDIFNMFQEDLCPPTHQLTSWAAQMVVSRERIMANPPSKYRRLLDLLEAPNEHWVYAEGADSSMWIKSLPVQWRGNMSSTNPFLGHALERSWPLIFNCTDPSLAQRCGDNTFDKDGCQCYDL